jgi:hypothetical protein
MQLMLDGAMLLPDMFINENIPFELLAPTEKALRKKHHRGCPSPPAPSI